MRVQFRAMLRAVALGLLGLAARPVSAQSTDAYHAIQVLPVVVDTASFAQRIHLRAAYPWDTTTLSVSYYPAQGTAQATAQPAPLACNGVELAPGQSTEFSSLRALCPGLVAGSAFGTLVLRSANSQPFAAYSRVSNPQGNGFSVEAFAANEFTSADLVVTGVRRLAAAGQAPAFQSNCFVGEFAEFAPSGPPATTNVELSLRTPAGVLLGQLVVPIKPGQLVRLLDVFAAAGVPAGDVADAVASFRTPSDTDRGGLFAFCTVQDNTSFGADFRIGKQELAYGVTPGAQDDTAARGTWNAFDDQNDDNVAFEPLAIAPGASRSVHLFYFRHPDVIACKLRDGNGESILVSYGLELRLRVRDSLNTWRVLAGGNDATEFSGLYLGDKRQQGNGANTAYQLEVESNGRNEGATRTYIVTCTSGSGHTRGERIRSGLPVAF